MSESNQTCFAVPLLILALSATPARSDETPLAPWGVHTIVSDGRPFYEGEKLRAVLSYGETGGPEVTVEHISVEIGYPSQNRVLWRFTVDLIAGLPEPCPLAETYCATVEDMRWTSGQLTYAFVGPDFRLACRVSGIREREPQTACEAR